MPFFTPSSNRFFSLLPLVNSRKGLSYRLHLLACSLFFTLSTPLAQAQRAACGLDHSAVIYPDGTLWTWGRNDAGQLGNGTLIHSKIPVQIGIAHWQSVTCGGNFTLAIRNDGTLWGWGNSFGTVQLSPVQVGLSNDWQSISAGYLHTLGLRTDGTLWAWGNNSVGQLGDGTTTFRSLPIQIGSATDWQTVSASTAHSAATKTNGTVWTWGWNRDGQLGHSTQLIQVVVPTQVGSAANWRSVSSGDRYTLAVRTDGTLWGWGASGQARFGPGSYGYYYSSPHQIGTDSNWLRAMAGQGNNVSFVLRNNNSLWACGGNQSGQLGNARPNQAVRDTLGQVSNASNWLEVALGARQCVGIRADGSIWAWGLNEWGQVGSAAVQVGNRVFPEQMGSGTYWESADAGDTYSMMMRQNGTLWGRGYNLFGQLGDGTIIARDAPTPIGTATNWRSISAGNENTLGIQTDGTLWGWGRNQMSELGDGTTTQHISPVQIGNASNWQSVSFSYGHTLAIRTDGTLWAWGNNSVGQLGDGTNIASAMPKQIGMATNWKMAKAAYGFSVAIRTDGTLWAWGANSFGQLGDGTTLPRLQPVPIGSNTWLTIDATEPQCLAIRTDGTLWAWGRNSRGELGDGTTIQRNSPVQIGAATNWRTVSTGGFGLPFSVAIRADGTLWAWGNNTHGQLGDGTTVARTTPGQVGVATNWKTAEPGTTHIIATCTDGTLWHWGSNYLDPFGFTSNYIVYAPILIYPLVITATQVQLANQVLFAVPNPAHDQVSLPGVGTNAHLRLLDLQGRLVRSVTGSQMTLAGLVSGLYLLQSTAPGQPVQTTKLMIE